MVEVYFSGMLNNSIMLVLYNGEYYKVRAADTQHVASLIYKIHHTKLLETNKVNVNLQ